MVVMVGEHGTISLRRLRGGQVLWSVKGDEQHAIERFCLSADDQLIAVVTKGFDPGTYRLGATIPPCLTLWRVGDQNPLLSLPSSGLYAHKVSAIAFSPDSKLLAAGNCNGGAYLVNVAWPHVTAVLAEGLKGPVYHLTSPEITCCAFSPDGQCLAWASADGEVKTFNVTAGQPGAARKLPARVHNLAFSPDGQLLVVSRSRGLGTQDRVYLLRVAGAQYLADFEGPSGFLCFSRDGRTLVGHNGSTVSGPHLAAAWSVPEGRALADFTLTAPFGPTPCAVSPDGQLLATANKYRTDKLDLVQEDSHIRLWHFLPTSPK
jgi:hypothetical protein